VLGVVRTFLLLRLEVGTSDLDVLGANSTFAAAAFGVVVDDVAVAVDDDLEAEVGTGQDLVRAVYETSRIY
jgi:hypothetical protein